MQSIVQSTLVKAKNKRVAGHMPRKTLNRKLGQLGYGRDEISAKTWLSNIKSLDSYLETMNERKSTELSLAVSGFLRAALQAENSSTTTTIASRLAMQDNDVRHRIVSATTSSQMSLSSQSLSASSTTAGSQLPAINLSSVTNNISGQATVNITFNLQLPPQ